MAKDTRLGLTAKKESNFLEWYNEVVVRAEMADYSAVKGCMVIRPRAYTVWESIQEFVNTRIKANGVQNAYFPLFIPERFFKREAEHAQGFHPEVAWIGNKDEEEERLAVRPTSETIISESFAKWLRSHRDLPIKINQWANVVRWETKTTRLFLRTREFLWQEGHCLYETNEQAEKEVLFYLDLYEQVARELLAVPVIKGRKSEMEKFAGALYTTAIEGFMPSGMALQLGTSHNLGQGFMRAFGVEYLGRDSQKHNPWYISWGISTRVIGAAIMQHSDDKGLVLPPNIAYSKAVIVPILFDDTREKVLAKAKEVKELLSEFNAVLDDREEYSPGWKFNEWELKGMPLRIELGPKDLENEQAVVVRRDTGEKKFVKLAELKEHAGRELEAMQKELLAGAEKHLKDNTVEASTYEQLEKGIKENKLVIAPFCGRGSCEESLKEKLGASSRCFPFNQRKQDYKCIHCGDKAGEKAYFAKAY